MNRRNNGRRVEDSSSISIEEILNKSFRKRSFTSLQETK